MPASFRPIGRPAFGIGGFGDKFNSLHSYGLAADMTGIGGPGSRFARLWQDIVRRVGLYLPYGPDNRAEFNHTQLVPTKMARVSCARPSRRANPRTCSDVARVRHQLLGGRCHGRQVLGATPLAAKPANLASVAGPADGDKQAPAPQQPARVAAPRAVRARPGRKRGAPPRGRHAEGQRSPRPRTGKSTRNLDWMRRVLSPF